MIIKKNFYLVLFILNVSYFFFFFYKLDPFWGLMDDATSIKLSLQFADNPLKTTYEWLKHHNKNGMFRPLFPLQQFLQYYFYNFYNPISTHLLNVFIVCFSFYIFSLRFIKKNSLIFFYSIILLWPYTYDWLLMPTLNEKWGLIFVCFGLGLKNNSKNIFLKLVIGLFSVLIKLNVIILLPLSFVYEYLFNKKYYLSLGMSVGLLIQIYFFFSNPNSYYNTGLINTFQLINFFTLQNLIVVTILIIMGFDFLFSKNTQQNKLLIVSSFLSIITAFIILNLRNSSFGYLGALLIFPISTYLVNLYEKYFYNLKSNYSFRIFLVVFSLVISNLFFLIPRLQRWNDIGNIIELNFVDNPIYFCSEGQILINIWDIEKNNPKFSYFDMYFDVYENIGVWQTSQESKFKFLGPNENMTNYKKLVYIIDPYCNDSELFYKQKLTHCKLNYLYNSQIRVVKVNSC